MKMQFRPVQAEDINLALYINDYSTNGWVHFSAHPLKQSDSPHLPSGFRTMQFLLKKGYTLLPSEKINYASKEG